VQAHTAQERDQFGVEQRVLADQREA